MRDYISKEYSLSIDFLDYSKNKDTEVKSIIYSEKDTNTAFVIADLFANGESIDLNGYDKVVVGVKKSDGLRIQNDCIILDSFNGKIEIPFTTQSLASIGVNYFDITLYKDKSELVSPKFSYRVMEAMIDDNTLESSNEFGTLVLLIEKTEELLNRTNDACDRVENLEQVVTANESVRNTNEETRKSNETTRVSAENTRKSNETTRINSENVRISSENTRVSFYNDTVAKESIRVTKENERIASENTRVSSEASRISEENIRKSNETSRVGSESSRVSAENTRKSNETTRISSEQTRMTNEYNRESQFEILSDNMIDTNTHWDTAFQNRYDNLNQEYSELVDTLDKDVLINRSSEELFNADCNSFKVGTGEDINGVYQDYSSDMEQSLVSIDNIEGKTLRKDNVLRHVDIGNLYTQGEKILLNESNFSVSNNNTEYSFTNGILNVSALAGQTFTFVRCSIDGLEVGAKYSFFVDIETNNNDLNPLIDCVNKEGVWTRVFDSYKHFKDKLLAQFIYNGDVGFNIHFYSTTNHSSNADSNVIFKNITLIKHKETISQNSIELYSVPDGTCDILKDGEINRFTKKIQLRDLHWSVDENYVPTHGVTRVFKAELPNAKLLNDLNSIDVQCGYYRPTSENGLWSASTECVCTAYNHTNMFVWLKLMTSSEISTPEHLVSWLSQVDDSFIYRINKTSDFVNTSLLVNSDDVIHVDSPIPVTCMHKVQLNTKSQVEELQLVVKKEKKSVYEKIKKIFDCNYHISGTGYIKFPSIFGGILIQWGATSNSVDNMSARVGFPIAFTEDFFNIQLTGQWGYSHDHYWVLGNTDRRTFFEAVKTNSLHVSDNVFWIAIGK